MEDLGLTEDESTQIRKAIGLRALHPASLAQIWDFCSKSSQQTPGVFQPHSSIDQSVFTEYAEYMVFASNYECAYEIEVRRAEDFLRSRKISTELLGTWLPDPSDLHGSEFLRHVAQAALTSGRPARPAALATTQPNDSGYSSLSEADPAAVQTAPKRRPRAKKATQKEIAAKEAAERRALVYSIKQRPPVVERTLLDIDANALRTVARHPLATVSKPGESPTPPRSGGQHARESGENFRPYALQSGLHSATARLNNVVAQQTRQPRFVLHDQRSAAFTNARVRGKPPAMTLSPAHMQDGRSNLDQETAAEETRISDSTITPQRLVLKVQEKDGLARVFRKTPPQSSNATTENATAKVAQSVNVPSSESLETPKAPMLPALPFSTRMSGFSRGLVMGCAQRSMPESTVENTFVAPASDVAAITTQPCRKGPIPFPADPSKRKASQTDIRPDSSKVQRLLTNATPATPPDGLVADSVDHVDRLHSEAKKSYGPATLQMHASSETSTPTKIVRPVFSVEQAEGTMATANDCAMAEQWLPRSPPFSPISENEELEDFQALLLGPMKHRLRVKVPALGNVTSSDTDYVPTPTSSTFNTDFHRRLNVVTPATSESGQQTEEDVDNKKSNEKVQTLKLIVRAPIEASSRNQTTSPHAPIEQVSTAWPEAAADGDANSAAIATAPSKVEKLEKNKTAGPKRRYKKSKAQMEKEAKRQRELELRQLEKLGVKAATAVSE